MKNYQDSQFNRGRCIYQSKRKPVLTENENETDPENSVVEKDRDSSERDSETAKKEITQNKTYHNA